MHLAVIGFTGSFETKKSLQMGGGSEVIEPCLTTAAIGPPRCRHPSARHSRESAKQIQLGPSPAIDTYIL